MVNAMHLLSYIQQDETTANKSNCNDTDCETYFENYTIQTSEEIGSNETYIERSIGFLIIGAIGIVANAFVIVILGSSAKIRKKLVNTLIIHQSYVDLLASIILIGTAHLDGLDDHGLEGLHADVYCFFVASKWPLWVMIDISSFNLIFLNVERYISIVHPIYHHTKVTRKRVLLLLPLVWFLGFLEQYLFCSSFKSENGICVFTSEKIIQAATINYIICHFFLPVLLVAFLYGHMIIRLRSSSNSGASSTNRNEVMEKAQKNVFKTMLFITICYAVCYVFNCIFCTLVIVKVLDFLSGK